MRRSNSVTHLIRCADGVRRFWWILVVCEHNWVSYFWFPSIWFAIFILLLVFLISSLALSHFSFISQFLASLPLIFSLSLIKKHFLKKFFCLFQMSWISNWFGFSLAKTIQLADKKLWLIAINIWPEAENWFLSAKLSAQSAMSPRDPRFSYIIALLQQRLSSKQFEWLRLAHSR